MSDILLQVKGLRKAFKTGAGTLTAVDGADLTIRKGETLALAGESGCGKSTLGRMIANLTPPDEGSVTLQGTELVGLSRRALRPWRPRIQMIFQDPFSSLNPRATVARILEEPLIVHRRGNAAERRLEVARMMERVGLRPEAATRYPHEFSGGQRQRIGIARALMLRPELVICDEPVSALDVSVRAQILNLLGDLQQEMGLSYLFISHDLSVVQHLADRVAVMYLGKIVELGGRDSFWSEPAHPYTHALMSARPLPGTGQRLRDKQILEGEMPSPIGPRQGCDFRARCRHAFGPCAAITPELRRAAAGHEAACHLVPG
ncbi:ATP-binding cassette domain-containing protein [Paracoccus pantotrophus]|uniref:ABC transporter ATP-binding protein n=1 Tax=Paracoccus pantotrophus TaxID=82367 RepID=UPI000E09C675|nr:oligopeptide/dipeptide ABC transporter ATP-binding protein [Paracoccus pantotrophus]RDD95282.1 ATP-binding cassette domain-containing protein [Paracoccus pantotrophus]WGR64174.1 ATP-binding cassette domain-containing protein [Paracoccus pantotrophus]